MLAGAVGWWDVGAYPGSGQVLPNRGTGGSALDAQFGSTTGTDTNDPRVLPYTGSPYVALPGVTGNYLSVPDAAALDITGDIEMWRLVTLDSYNTAANQTLVNKGDNGVSTLAYRFRVDASGPFLAFIASSNGSTVTVNQPSAAHGLTNGTTCWVGVTLDADNGAGGKVVSFYRNADVSTVPTVASSTLISSHTLAGTLAMFSSSAALELGAANAGTVPTGRDHRAIIRNGNGGSTVLDVDTSVLTSGSAASFAALTGQTVTINRSASGRKAVAVVRPVILFGTDDYLTVPDNDLLDFADVDSFTVLVVARQHGTQGAYSRLIAKMNNGSGWAVYNQISTTEVRGYVSDGTLSRFISAGASYPGSALGVSAMVRDRPNALLRLYGNGVQAGSVADAVGQMATISNGLVMSIGRTSGGAEWADMEFVGAAVFRRALSATEIAQITAYYQQRMP